VTYWSLATVVVLWALAVGVVLALGLRDASHAMAQVTTAKANLSAADLVSGGPGPQLLAAGAWFTRAKSLLDSPLMAPIDVLPVLGRQLRSVQDLAGAAAQVSDIGARAVTEARTVLDAPHHLGPDRITALRRLARLGQQTDAALARINTGPSEALIGPVASKHNDFLNQLDQARSLGRGHGGGRDPPGPRALSRPHGEQRRDAGRVGGLSRGRPPHHLRW
jgi:hypothetical protein